MTPSPEMTEQQHAARLIDSRCPTCGHVCRLWCRRIGKHFNCMMCGQLYTVGLPPKEPLPPTIAYVGGEPVERVHEDGTTSYYAGPRGWVREVKDEADPLGIGTVLGFARRVGSKIVPGSLGVRVELVSLEGPRASAAGSSVGAALGQLAVQLEEKLPHGYFHAAAEIERGDMTAVIYDPVTGTEAYRLICTR